MPDSILQSLTECSNLMRSAYWKEKDLARALEVARDGIRRGEEAADDYPDMAMEFLSQVKRLCYDIASFTWIGWAEPGIQIEPADANLGFEMARKNLRYAISLSKGDLPTSRAYWMVGAHLLTSGNSLSAVDEFEEAETFAILAGSEPDTKLCQAFLMLASIASHGSYTTDQLTTFLGAMDSDSDTAPFAEQVRTAGQVIGIFGI